MMKGRAARVITNGIPRTTTRTLSRNILVGKDILELLSSAMYADPLTVVREYVQNAVDSIDEARAERMYIGKKQPRIDILLNLSERKLRIRDNGTGIKRSAFERRLLAFGGSKKRGARARGFRGVGRLSALGYCQELVFRSRAAGESVLSEMTWDGRHFKQILLDHTYKGDLNDVVREVTVVGSRPASDYPPHFFEVELRGVARLKDDTLLNETEIERYLAEAGPVPFHPKFRFGDAIQDFLSKYGSGDVYDIFVSVEAPAPSDPRQIFRAFRNTFAISKTRQDKFVDIEFIEIPGVDDEDRAAVGWILHHGYNGAVPRHEGIKGLRLRSGNIQVGMDSILAQVFPEPRFNSWTVGEIHVITSRVVPNGRRDDFEPNTHYLNICGHLAARAKTIARTCREKSKLRNRERQFAIEKAKIEEKLKLLSRSSLPVGIKKKLRREVTLHVKQLEKIVESVVERRSRSRLERELQRVRIRAGKRVDEVMLRDPLARFPKAKQNAYRHVISLVFECAPSHPIAGALVSRLLTRLAREP